jgi:hypothetical protein
MAPLKRPAIVGNQEPLGREPADTDTIATGALSTPSLPDNALRDDANGQPRPSRTVYAVGTAVIISAGLLCRLPGSGLPWPVAKWSGSILWGAMVYFLVALARPDAGSVRKLAVAMAIALSVELSRLYHSPWLDEFRTTVAGAILLGRIFSPWNMVAYAIGALTIGIFDTRWIGLLRRSNGAILAGLSPPGRKPPDRQSRKPPDGRDCLT